MTNISLKKPHGFSLAAATSFYAGFIPGSGMAVAAVDHLTLAFRLEGTFEAVAVALREEESEIVGEYAGTTNEGALSAQVARMLGLDADASAWLAVGERDPVVGRLQSEFSGFFTAAKPSPYDAAVWAIIAQRMNMAAAARLKIAMAQKHGDAVSVRGRAHHVFPSPRQLMSIDSFPGLHAEKLVRLEGIARAALDGKLEVHRLRALGEEKALDELQALRGIGPWAASHVYFRGAAPADALPTAEPRVLHGLAQAYGLEAPTTETFRSLAEAWRPFRMWVCILLARHLHRTGGWNAPEIARERAAAGRQLRGRSKQLTAQSGR